MRTKFTGLGTALVTPFTKSGEMDEQAVRRLGRRQIDNGTHFLVPIGTTGENPTLEARERIRMVEILVDEAKGQVPVLAGCGGYNTKEIVHLAKEMQKAGADGVLSVTPYYNKPTQEGIVQHFKAIADATPLPIVLYNIAGRTGVNIETPTIARLAQVPTIIGVKEASGSLSQMCDVLRSVPSEFLVLSGDDALTLPLMAVGGRGVISVVSNEIPKEMGELVRSALANDRERALELQRKYEPLMEMNYLETSPGPVKCALSMMKKCGETLRLPLVPVRDETRKRIEKTLGGYRLLPRRGR